MMVEHRIRKKTRILTQSQSDADDMCHVYAQYHNVTDGRTDEINIAFCMLAAC